MRRHVASPIQTAEFVIDPKNIGRGDIGPQETGALVADLLQDRYAELFAVIDADQLAHAVLAWVRLHAPQGQAEIPMMDQLRWGETAVYELLQRGALAMVVQTPEATADFQKLAAAVEKAGLRPQQSAAVATESASTPAEIQPIDQCVADFRSLDSSEFRAKWMKPNTRPIFDEAVQRGLL